MAHHRLGYSPYSLQGHRLPPAPPGAPKRYVGDAFSSRSQIMGLLLILAAICIPVALTCAIAAALKLLV